MIGFIFSLFVISIEAFTGPAAIISTSSSKRSFSHGVKTISHSINENNDLDKNTKLIKHNILSVVAAVSNIPVEFLTTPPPTDPHPPKTSEEKENRMKVNEILSNAWTFTAGYDTQQEEIDEIDRLMGSDDIHQPSTYGEITHLGSRQLFYFF